MNCRSVQDVLPEYVAGRFVESREQIAGHLSACEACDAARRETEAVFALLTALPLPDDAPYCESNARLALRSEVAPGPLRANAARRRHEDLRLILCSLVSFTGAAGGGFALYRARSDGWTMQSLEQRLTSLPSSPIIGTAEKGLILFALVSALIVLLPALILGAHSKGSLGASGRGVRREV